jgi:hypothetical protein
MKTRQLALTFVALAALPTVADRTASPARAAVIYDNGAVPNAGLASDAGGFFIRADDFILPPGESTITGVEWTGFYGSAIVHVDDDFTIQFFNSQSAGAPPPFETLEEPQDANLAIATIDVVNPNRTESGGIFSYSASSLLWRCCPTRVTGCLSSTTPVMSKQAGCGEGRRPLTTQTLLLFGISPIIGATKPPASWIFG